MPYIYPHTDLNQQNLDWVIREIQALKQAIGNIALSAGNLSIAWEAAEMTDHNVIYLYVGPDEPGYIFGYTYEWDSTDNRWEGHGRLIPDNPVPIVNGGTGSTTKAGARAALEITPANIGAEPAITSDSPLAVTKGGTGASTAAGAITNLGITAAAIGAEPTITTLPISKGGTNATTAAAALTNLGAQAEITTANPLDVTKGGTGASTAAAALTSLGAEPAITTLPISKGGTGSSTAAAARTALHALGSSDIVFEQKEGSATSVAAGASGHVEIDASKSGYTLEGIVSFFGSGTSNFQWTDVYFSGSTVYMYFKNTSSSTQSITPKCRCIYVKTV